jgi:hypothetical protein
MVPDMTPSKMSLDVSVSGTYKVRNEIETKRNEINENETKRNQRNGNKMKQNQRNRLI